ncbi:aldo/keto reductase [Rubrobacter naiadicus]|uniref:aldo/keto reductase n=1 Tax=Rubrobacter naiadicus TaxID=1392641 RepID=UPI002360AC9D|nr:aldo/keto reductase [Rubrobacter naiadicus]
MKYRTIQGTDISVSEVGFGVWTITTGWWGDVDRGKARSLLKEAWDLGINYFDTADTYGRGFGEEVLAEAGLTSGSMRDDVVISTKFGYDFYNHAEREGQRERPQNWSEGFLRFALEQSLKRLDTDYIDFIQLHNPKSDAIDSDALFELLEDFRREGKVRAYGVALGPAIGWREEGLRAIHDRRVQVVQMIYNILEQDPGRDFIAAAREAGSSLVVRVPHSSGMLEGHYDENTTFPENDHRRHRPKEWLVEGVRKVEQLRFLEERGRTLGQAALKFCLAEPEVVSTLPNIYGREQLVEFASAPDTPDLIDEELARIGELYENNFGLASASRR